jgi:transcriptional regulator with XRE-family HTH domain
MDDQRIGWSLRSIRIRKRWRQEDLSARAGVSRWVVMRIERGRLGSVSLGTLRAVAAALDARVDAFVRWQGGDLSRLVSARHARMHEMIARYLSGVPGWIVEPEVSFSIYGERGIIDVLAWHPTSRILLVIELKTEVIDLNEMLGTLDRKRRLAWAVAKDRKLDPAVVGTWVVVADSRTNRRTVAEHGAVLRAKLPIDGRGVARWLRRPAGGIDALSFLPNVQGMHLGVDPAPIRRVSKPKSGRKPPVPSVD